MSSVLKVDEIQNTGGTTGLTIDSSGRVTSPSKPSFFAQKTNGSVSGTNVVVYNNVLHNIGNCYSNSTGRFTAPLTGVFHFSAMGIVGSGSGNQAGELRLRVNGSTYILGHVNHGDSWESITVSGAVYMTANQYADIHYTSTAGSATLYGSTQYCTFSGHLVG